MALTAGGCQPGSGGSLEPAAGQARGGDGPTGENSVSLVSNALAVEVSGSWHSNGPANRFDLYAVYRNLGDRPVVLDAAAFAADRGRNRGAALSVVDLTGVDYTDDRTDNDEAVSVIDVFNDRKAGTIRIDPGGRRVLSISAYLTDDAVPLADGQSVRVFVPTVRGLGEAIFTVDDGWF